MWIVISAGALIVLILLFAAMSFYFSNLIIFPRKVEYKETYRIGVKSGEIDTEVFNKLQKEELFIDSYHDYQIHGLYFPCGNSQKVVIIAHGITWSLFGSYKYVEMFHEKGYNVLLCDHRFHGLSGGNHTSFGYFEKDDLQAWVDYFYDRIGSSVFVGVLGESLGGASALQFVKKDKRVGFCISDCSFSDLTSLLRLRLKADFKIRFEPLISFTSFVTRLRYGWGFREISPIAGLDKLETPVLFIHGVEDDFIPYKMSVDMYHLKKGIKKLYLVPNAGHAQAFLADKTGYKKHIGEFLKEIEHRKIRLPAYE